MGSLAYLNAILRFLASVGLNGAIGDCFVFCRSNSQRKKEKGQGGFLPNWRQQW